MTEFKKLKEENQKLMKWLGIVDSVMEEDEDVLNKILDKAKSEIELAKEEDKEYKEDNYKYELSFIEYLEKMKE
jgi:hypothetical protein